MSRNNNFLLGHGDRLTEKVSVPKGGAPKKEPYEFNVAKKRISKKLLSTTSAFSLIPSDACPGDEVVAVVTMHPRYVSKSDFPDELFKLVGLRAIGSKPSLIKPEKWGIKKHDEKAITEQIFVAGKKSSFINWANNINSWLDDNMASSQISKIEELTAFESKDKIKEIDPTKEEATLEVVLHNTGNNSIIRNFELYARKLDARPLMDKRRDVKGLTFLPVKASLSIINDLAEFQFLRVLRSIPRLRPIDTEMLRWASTFELDLPLGGPVNKQVRAAIFDGGIPLGMGLDEWVTLIEPPGIGKARDKNLEHGLAVTSAFLFGNIVDKNLPQPFCGVDHIRVLDDTQSDIEAIDVLDRIIEHLDKNHGKYKYINLSVGPDIPISDDEVNSWTARLDEKLSKSNLVVTVAVGNNGHKDAIPGANRISPPSDGVNVLAVGSSNETTKKWQRASYSNIGPGRRPGVVKPDGLAFGGSNEESFMVISPSTKHRSRAEMGTSFAAPAVLRATVGVETYIGSHLSAIAVRALMIHRTEDTGKSKIDVGWGLFETDVSNLITCEDDEAIVIYQGELPVGEHLRAAVPLPKGSLNGKVTITATLVISPEIDPEHPGAYTRSGLEVFFRPHSDNFKQVNDDKKPKHQKTKTFFNLKGMYGGTEYKFREDGYKWEPCIKSSRTFRSMSLKEPCFDIYYHHREGAVAADSPKPIPYALIISIKALKEKDFYNKVVRAYANILVPLKPQIEINIMTRN